MSERDDILEVIRDRVALAPDPIIALQIAIFNSMSSASLIEQMRNCASILAARICGEPAMYGVSQRESYEQWIAALTEMLEVWLTSVRDAAVNPGRGGF